MRSFRLFLFGLIAFLPLACKPSPPALAKVRGIVTVNGSPLRRGTIVFAPDRQRGARGDVAHAVIADDGSYELATTQGPGAAPGWHRITVAPPADAGDLIERMDKYRYPESSGLTREVKPNESNEFEIRIVLEP